jgi:hypothetical protein
VIFPRCRDTWCSLATAAAIILLEHGYCVKELYGGVAAWQSLHLPEEQLALGTNFPRSAPVEMKHDNILDRHGLTRSCFKSH